MVLGFTAKSGNPSKLPIVGTAKSGIPSKTQIMESEKSGIPSNHGKKETNNMNSGLVVDDDHKCDHCPKKFKERYNLNKHLKLHHQDKWEEMQEAKAL